MNSSYKHVVTAAAMTLAAVSIAAAQPTAPLVPALTPEQIKHSQELAAKYDQSAAREKVRLETFKNRPLGVVLRGACPFPAHAG